MDPIWDAVSIYDGGDLFLQQFAGISRKQQVLFATHWAQSEICNGGLHQFFSNSTGVLAPEAVEGFRGLEMTQCAQAIQTGMEFFGSKYPRDRGQRNERLAEYEKDHEDAWDPFEALDDVFFDSIEVESGGFNDAATRYAYDA